MQVSMVAPAKPSSTAPAMVSAMVWPAVNSPAPALAPAAEDHSNAERGTRRATGAKLTPTNAAPTDHSAEYTPSTV